MPRIGISYLDVATTATQLFEQNIRPSIEAVRQKLGTGSNSTINQYLRQWREKQGNQLEAQQGLPDTLLVAVKGLYEAMQADATQKIDKIEVQSTQTIHDLQQHLTQLKNNHAELIVQKQQADEQSMYYQHQTEQSQQTIQQLQQTIDKKDSDQALLQARLIDKTSEIERLIQQVKHAQHNLEHYRDTIRQQREEEKQRYEAQISKLEQQTYQQQTHNNQLQQTVAAQQKQIEIIENQYKVHEENSQQLFQKYHDQTLLIQQQTTSLNQLQKEYHQLLINHGTMAEESELAKDKNHDLTINLGKTHERIEMLTLSLKKAEDKINVLNNKNLFLSQEKTELQLHLKHLKN